jgi:hypothetical protein
MGFKITLLSFFMPVVSLAGLAGPPITNSDYAVAINPTSSYGSSRKVSMGGAFVAIAEGVDSLSDNPAGVAYRRPGSTGTWSAGGSLGVYQVNGNDIDNNGNPSDSYKSQQFNTLGGLLQYGQWGIGVYAVSQKFLVEGEGAGQEYDFGYGFLNLGYTSRNRDWTWGIGARPASLAGRPSGGGARVLELRGTSPNAGVLWHPQQGPLRVGAAYHGHLKDAEVLPPDGAIPFSEGSLIPPQKVVMPTVVSFGASYELEKGHFWLDHPLLVSGQINIMGRTPNAVGIESFLEQKIQLTGERTTVGFHLGGEYEALPKRLRIRGGSYWEPSRFTGVNGRLHGTGGIELYLFKINFIGTHHVSFSYAADYASSYLTQFFGLGFWAF